MPRFTLAVLLGGVSLLAGACASPAPSSPPATDSELVMHAPPGETGASEPDARADRLPMTSLFLYLPSRIVDAFDVVRFGVEIGPGLGLDVQVTESAEVAWMTRVGFGLGFQSLRHGFGRVGLDTNYGIGPFGGTLKAMNDWYRSYYDVRVDAHALVAGGHVAFEPMELVDFLGGFIGLDPADDDF